MPTSSALSFAHCETTITTLPLNLLQCVLRPSAGYSVNKLSVAEQLQSYQTTIYEIQRLQRGTGNVAYGARYPLYRDVILIVIPGCTLDGAHFSA